ncbi:hypothetical protein [Photorhabdus heterorhabditis]|uniref:Glycosyltransferase family 4 protein n=1 Tax=Photorhabdus heterorhabditis TaxID=880156 RepID=A0A5B0X7Y2_9GAMM|nr:hypothetical protein [Photorhabdus heterorhabditis]KAA1194765.1 hypothetical protein F0L16_05375 [Photorhabdus heterorhabditis]
MNNNRIYIYHPSKYLGGSEVLFSRIVTFILQRISKNIFIIDYKDGVLSKKLYNDKVQYLYIEDKNWQKDIEGQVVIASGRNIFRLIYECKQNGISLIKPFFWLLHPSELYSGYFLASGKIKKIMGYNILKHYLDFYPGHSFAKNIIKELDKNGNIWIMDGACKNESEWAYSYKFRKNCILPLITNLETVKTCVHAATDVHRILVLSRLDDFKTYGIIKLIHDITIYSLKTDKRIEIDIIGDGKEKNHIISLSEKLTKNTHNLKLNFLGYIENSYLNITFQKNNYDLLFAMGTSALEGVSRGIVTVLLPVVDKEITNKDDVYKFLHDIEDASLGEHITSPFSTKDYKKFSFIMHELINNRKELEDKTIHYFSKNYSIPVTTNRFISTINQMNFIKIKELKMNKLHMILLNLINKIKIRSGF